MNATKTVSLREFWNANEVKSVFVVGIGCPAGQELVQNLEDDGEDYCDLNEVIDSGLAHPNEQNESPLWELTGTVDESGDWTWDGNGSVRDIRGNNYTRIKLTV